MYSIVVILGDGIGIEVIEVVIIVLEVVVKCGNFFIKIENFFWGFVFYKEMGVFLLFDFIMIFKRYDVVLFGFVGFLGMF